MNDINIFENVKFWVCEYFDRGIYKYYLYFDNMILSLQVVSLIRMIRKIFCDILFFKYMFYCYFLQNIIFNFEVIIIIKMFYIFVIGYCIYFLYIVRRNCVCYNMFVVVN